MVSFGYNKPLQDTPFCSYGFVVVVVVNGSHSMYELC